MTEFAGRTAVITGSGMGRELVRLLVAEACNVAMCDVSPTGLAETQRLCEAVGLPQGLRVTTHVVDVADGTQVERFRDEALTSAAQAATIILDGVKADRWRILVGADAHKIDEMVCQSPERAYDIAFFDEFARAAGWTERLSLEAACCFIPGLAPPTSCLPSLGAVLLPPLSTARGRIAVL